MIAKINAVIIVMMMIMMKGEKNYCPFSVENLISDRK